MKYNFLIEINGIFSLSHIIYLLIISTLIIIGLILTNKFFKDKLWLINLIFAIVLTLNELNKVFTYVNFDNTLTYSEKNAFPLYYCSLTIYALWLSLFKNNHIKKIGTSFLITGGIVGALIFLIYPHTVLDKSPWNYIESIRSMFYHGAMLFVSLINLFYSDIKPTFKNFIYYFILLLIFSMISICLSYKLDFPFMFFYEAKNLPSPLTEICEYSKTLYNILVIIGYSLLYLPVSIIYKLYIAKRAIKKL